MVITYFPVKLKRFSYQEGAAAVYGKTGDRKQNATIPKTIIHSEKRSFEGIASKERRRPIVN